MDPAEAQDLVDAHPLTYPESYSEEAEVSESCWDGDSSSVASSHRADEFGGSKRPHDDASLESSKRPRANDSTVLDFVCDGPCDKDRTIVSNRGGAGESSPLDVEVAIAHLPSIPAAAASSFGGAARM